MPLPITIPNTFANATATIPLSQLDNNFATVATAVNSIGNGAFSLANVQVTGGTIANVTLDNVSVDVETLSNVTITNLTVNGNATLTNAAVTANTATITTANVTTANVASFISSNVSITGGSLDNVTIGSATAAAANVTNLTVNGNTTLGDANTDTILMTAAPSIGGAGLGMGFGFRNRIINGAMVIDQRNAGASKTITDTGANTYTLDRWFAYGNNASKFSVQQNAGSVTPPAGFTNYLGVTSLAATSVAAGDQYILGQAIEGFNVADFAWGTANAQAVTLSFRVYSSLTGTFGGALRNSAGTRSYPFTYSVASANTWTTATVTVAGDTSGTWLTNNGVGLYLYLGLGVGSTYLGTAGAWAGALYTSATGSTNVVSTNGATFYITGVQLEKGSTATSFDYRPYGTELELCERYAQFIETSANGQFSSGTMNVPAPYRTTMRSSPSSTAISVRVSGGVSAYTLNNTTVYGAEFQITANASNPYVLGARYLLTAEL